MAISFAIALIDFALGVQFLPGISEPLRFFGFKLRFLLLEFMLFPLQKIDTYNEYLFGQLSSQQLNCKGL